ncbi:hypothetical protein FNW52_05360 [Flavobacterium sp. ZT3R18]|uniref:hypothetical protein n=1 Tax=Flavobacterium sp. ZT3R18 TaxID=2594429 RepID=UPI00117B9A1A|nr:hypothetical protein [Flavobacterium sp. ZT3R18]TRX37389.1 hypothetical protein FNW52_05360 [Flavobacterium sp. ZT3R18]
MSKNLKTFSLLLLTIIGLASTKLNAQSLKKENKTTFSIETDPSTFAFGGYAFHIRIKPKNSEHFVIGAGVYALDLPSLMVDLNKDNKAKGWNVRINSAYSLFGEYYFKEASNRWFVGLQTGIQNYKNTNSNILNKESKYSNLLIMPSLGYTWSPFKFPLYVKPWVGLGYTTKISGDNSIDNLNYTISPLVPFATLHIGYILN